MEIEGRIVEFDLTRLPELTELILELRPDITFNLAGFGVDRKERDPELAAQVNELAVGHLCEAAHGVTASGWAGSSLVHVGSALEYGGARGNLLEDTPGTPTTLYGKTKLAGTRAVSSFCRRTGFKAVTARLFTVYGPGEHLGRLLPSLVAAAESREPLPLTEGLQRRDFTYVEDVADRLLRLGVAEPQLGSVVNLATGRLTTVREFTEIAVRVLGIGPTRLRFGALPTRSEEMSHEPVNTERLRILTEWSPQTTIENGIRRTLGFEAEHGRWPSG
jgi:nucleoside-diphosphate-sugar epimerase